tara:strand:+ start:303 stop:998 length:696 start_codon:yes stop_codon:yes gene_type:complete
MYYITGVSSGLGKALAEKLLSEGKKVTGIGRNNSIEHSNYSFLSCDLRNHSSVVNLQLEVDQQECILINNAGMIGTIDRFSNSDHQLLQEVIQVNTISPMELAKKFYTQLKKKDYFTLVNISSGAANKAIPSWAAYCASKAALNMMTEAFFLEEKELGHSPNIFCVAPGVIDTSMQAQIRNSSSEQFSSVENFKRMKDEGELFSPNEAADKLLRLLSSNPKETIFFDLREV